MTPDSVRYELDNMLTLLLKSDVAMHTTKVIVRREPGGFRRITWATNATVSGELFRHTSATVTEYRNWIDCGGYSATLFDGSLIQMSYDFDYSELVGHRLLYFPCPFDLDLELLQTLSLVEVIDIYRGEDISNVRLRAPMRFDYSPHFNSDTHPRSHMTFQWSHTRIPVMAPITPGRFIQFVFKHFYPTVWSIHSFIHEWPLHEVERTIVPEEQNVLYFDSVTPG